MTSSSPPAHTAAVDLFNAGRYLAAHELWDELWEECEGGDADFFKGLIQASIALHHFQSGNLEGTAKLYAGHRRFLAHFMPHHRALDVATFLGDMQRFCRPVLARKPGTTVAFDDVDRPRLHWIADESEE